MTFCRAVLSPFFTSRARSHTLFYSRAYALNLTHFLLHLPKFLEHIIAISCLITFYPPFTTHTQHKSTLAPMSAIILKSGLPIYFSQKSFSLDMPTTRPAQTPRLLAFKRRIKTLAFTESVALGLQGPRASNGVIFKDPLLDRMLVCFIQCLS